MKANLEKLSSLERRLKIEVPMEKVAEAFESVYRKIQREVTLKGFRKGKAPMTTIRSMYRDNAAQDVVQDLVNKNYLKALEEHELDPISFPNIQIDKMKEGETFSFSAEFEVRPEVKLQTYTDLKVDKEIFKVDETKVKTQIDQLLGRSAQMTPILAERPARKGDFAVIDFEGSVDGVVLENATGAEHTLELGSGDFIPGFEEKVEGMNVGEVKTIQLKFPEEYHAAELAGKDVSFKVTLKGLKQKELPVLDDEYAKKLGVESAEKLKETVRVDIESGEKRRIEEDFKNRLLRKLVEMNPVDVPKTMLEEQKKLLAEDVEGRLGQQGLNKEQIEDYKQKWDDDFAKTATFMIQSSFLINAIATKESLRAGEADIEAKMQEYAASAGIEIARLKGFYEKEENRTRLQFKITEDKVVAFLTEKAKVKEVPASEIKDPVQ
jgi:trigger factor